MRDANYCNCRRHEQPCVEVRARSACRALLATSIHNPQKNGAPWWWDMHKTLPVRDERQQEAEHRSQADLCHVQGRAGTPEEPLICPLLEWSFVPDTRLSFCVWKLVLYINMWHITCITIQKNIAYCISIWCKLLQFRIIKSKISVILTICAVLIFNEHSHYTVEQQMKEEYKACVWLNLVGEESQMVSVHYTQA